VKIAQVAPLFESVPPQLYGGTERVVSYLTEELVVMGHEVTLFASGDSRTSATLVPCWNASLRLHDSGIDSRVPHLLMFEQVFARIDQFDIVHFHTDVLHYPLVRRHPVPSITTLHGRLDLPCSAALHREYLEIPLVSISDSQRDPLPWANWVGTVHHGLPVDLYQFHPTAPATEPYLVFTGRISPEKRPDWAIRIARRAGVELRIAAKVASVDRPYFEDVVKPLLKEPGIEFIGEVDETEKERLLGGALGMLFPIDWPEPFGLVMIEAMACGTPTLAMRRGSVPEIITHGQSGFIVDNVDEAVQAVERLPQIDRRQCRACFEHRFTARRMAEDYLRIYSQRSRGIDLAVAGAASLQFAATSAPGALHDRR
jgi:glycosyltransferase involved in cell wall biosynthesis